MVRSRKQNLSTPFATKMMGRNKMPNIIRIALMNFLFFMAITLLSACAAPGHKMLIERLERGLNVMTYSDALKRWGKTPYVEKGDKFLTAVWIENYGNDYYMVETPEGEIPIPPYGHVKEMTLRFDIETLVLKDYKVEYR